MIKVAIVGYGNIGKYSVDALRAAPDMELVGIVRRAGSAPVHGIKTVTDISELGEVDVALLKGGKSAGIESAELGMFGVELGAGLTIPVGDDDGGCLFFDASAEIRDGYTNFNGTVGYRINF